jgi:hypothetical protein
VAWKFESRTLFCVKCLGSVLLWIQMLVVVVVVINFCLISLQFFCRFLCQAGCNDLVLSPSLRSATAFPLINHTFVNKSETPVAPVWGAFPRWAILGQAINPSSTITPAPSSTIIALIVDSKQETVRANVPMFYMAFLPSPFLSSFSSSFQSASLLSFCKSVAPCTWLPWAPMIALCRQRLPAESPWVQLPPTPP